MNNTQTLREFDRKHHPGQLDGLACLRNKRAILLREENEFLEAERILEFLRPYRLHEGEEVNETAIKAWKTLRKNGSFPQRPESATIPNKWFAGHYPTSQKLYGPAFLEEVIEDKKGKAKIVLVHLNEEAIAQALCGEISLNLRVIYHELEGQFYFYDYRVGAYCPTSEDRLKLLLSNMFIRCSESCRSAVDRDALFGRFRTPTVLTRIIQVAKVTLAADADFFRRTNSRQYVDNRYIDSSEKPSYQLFSERVEMTESDGPMPIGEACDQYVDFCHQQELPVQVTAFRKTFSRHVSNKYHKRLRHDVPNEDGKRQRGFFGLKFPPPDAILKN